uniref:3-hydroxyisobutyryl-CoA hydrolase n=1 Tax=Kalanchoe fedtschenkoi TaxID=63787 RepID=A0A7N0UHU4_KALFE
MWDRHCSTHGEYLGLTGARLDGPEMLACGLATHYVPSQKLSLLEEELVKSDSSDAAITSEIINKYSDQPRVKQKSAYLRLETIDKCFSRRTVEEIVSAVELEAAIKADDFINTTLQSFKKASPTSLKITLRSIRRGRLEGIGKCLTREYRMVCHVMLGHVSKDFLEVTISSHGTLRLHRPQQIKSHDLSDFKCRVAELYLSTRIETQSGRLLN